MVIPGHYGYDFPDRTAVPLSTAKLSKAIGYDFAEDVAGHVAAVLMAAGVSLGALGSANASIITGARVLYAGARDGRFPWWLGQLTRWGAPYTAHLAQAVWASALIALPISNFSSLLSYFSFASWTFYGLTGVSVIVLRRTLPRHERPFKVPCFPLSPILLGIMSVGVVVSSFIKHPLPSSLALIFLLLAIPVYYLRRKLAHKPCMRACWGRWVDLERAQVASESLLPEEEGSDEGRQCHSINSRDVNVRGEVVPLLKEEDSFSSSNSGRNKE